MSITVLIGRGSYFHISLQFSDKNIDEIFGVKEIVTGDNREVGTPGHMPNPEVKHLIADGTAEGIRGRVGRCQ